MMNGNTVSRSDFKPDSIPQTANYRPTVLGSVATYLSKAPPFTLMAVSEMLSDFRVRWGLWMIKGPILSKAKFFVDCKEPEVKQFLVETVTRFWRGSAMRALKAVEWGYSCSEAIYTMQDTQVRFHSLKDLHSLDSTALTKYGYIRGARIKRVPKRTQGAGVQALDLEGPKKFWHVHNREVDQYYGQSRLYGAYLPWVEIWADGGYRDSRRLFFHKYAYDGGGIYVPPGSTNVGDDGSGRARTRSNMELGREVVEKKRAGGVTILPGDTDDNGKRKWETIAPVVQPAPAGLMEYGETLKDEMWEGMGIPPEIGRAQGTGAYAGRLVPLISFYSILQEIIYWLITDADEQLFRPLVAHNFGPNIQYEIVPFSILDEAMADEESMPSPEGFDIRQEQPTPGNENPPPQGSRMSLSDDDIPNLWKYLQTPGNFSPIPMVF